MYVIREDDSKIKENSKIQMTFFLDLFFCEW